MDILRYRQANRARFMGADDDFVGPPAPSNTSTSNENLSAIFSGLSSIAKSVADTVVAGQISLSKTGLSYTGVPSTIPAAQQVTVAAKSDYSKYVLLGIPVAGFLLYAVTRKRR
jgi:hypothetical protein